MRAETLSLSELGLLHGQTNFLSNTRTVFRVDLVEVGNKSFLNILSALGNWSGNVFNQMSSLFIIENFSEESSWLLVIIIWMLVRISSDGALDGLCMNSILFVFNWTWFRTWLIVCGLSIVTVHGHKSITNIVCSKTSSIWAVDWNLLIIWPKTMSVSVWIV